MGWTFNCYEQTRAAFIAERIRTQDGTREGAPAQWATVAHRDCLSHIWKLVEIRNAETGAVLDTFIALDLIKRSRGEWGYKDICESMGPCEKDCPLSWLDRVPIPNDYGGEWRDEVRAYHSGQRERRAMVRHLAAGQRYMLTEKYGSKVCELVRPAVTKGHWLASIEGTTYRIRPAMLARLMGAKEVTIEHFMPHQATLGL